MDKELKLKKVLYMAGGKLAVDDPDTFNQIVFAIMDHFNITKDDPGDVMIANRMAATWMKILHIEEALGDFGLYYQQTNTDGSVIPRMQEPAYYLKQLEADFRSFYRLLNASQKNVTTDEKNISELLQGDDDDDEETEQEETEE